MTNEKFHINGRVINRESQHAVPGLRIEAWAKDTSIKGLLGSDKTDENGRFAIRLDEASYQEIFFKQKPSINFNVFIENTLIYSAKISVNWGVDAGEITKDIVVDITGPIQSLQGQYLVKGKVTSLERAGSDGLRVRIVDKNVGSDTILAESLTDTAGKYQVTFTHDLMRHGKAQPDLQAKVFSSDNTLIAASNILYNASSLETLDVMVEEASADALKSEHETLINNISSHFIGKLGDLKETDDQQDITYLANKTGWDARAVALAALADQFSNKFTHISDRNITVEPELFYALFRAGLPANENTLYQTDSETIKEIWKQSIEKGIIPKFEESKLSEIVSLFRSAASRLVLEGSASIGLSSFKDVLAISLGDNAQEQQKFAAIHTQFKNDLPKFWKTVRETFGEQKEKRLRLDGQLAYLTLNNAPLIQKLHAQVSQSGLSNIFRARTPRNSNGLSNVIDLVGLGYYHAAKWQEVIGNDAIPKEIKGANDEDQRVRYAEVLAAQTRLSFPTAVIAQMVKEGETPLLNGFANSVHAFLMQNQDKFEIGMQPIEQYIKKNNVRLESEVVKEISRIQRVYQITPSDDAMNGLLRKGIDSAYSVVRFNKESFVNIFKDQVGGEENAQLIYIKAQQVHNSVLNVALNYLSAKIAPGVGIHTDSAFYLNPWPNGPDNADDVIAYPTLEGLFGEMDFCECEHCRSILSPAAYFVDLLQFIDLPPGTFKKQNPLDVLLSRRPDLQHLPLTCENTNIPLPYIDIVNEVLEHYIINDLSLDDYRGHSTTEETTSAELMANPQFVSARAYEILAGKSTTQGNANPLLPPVWNLPFNRPLESLRRYFNKFEVSLSHVMEVLRINDNLERTTDSDYGWRDIWMEELLLSRAEYARLTDQNISLKQLFGYPFTMPNSEVFAELSNAKTFTRRIEISYTELTEILKTRFINPDSTLIPRLERLSISFVTMKKYKEGNISDEQLLQMLPPHLDESKYGGDIKIWLKNEANFNKIMGLITLTNPTATEEECSFDNLEFRYANPNNSMNQIKLFEFVRLIRFIRLWKKLGWTIEQTDKAITALYPNEHMPVDPNNSVNLQKLDAGFLVLLPRLGALKQLLKLLNLTPNRDLLTLLACFAPIDTHGANSLYGEMFLNPGLLALDSAFTDDGYGNYLADDQQKLLIHTESLRAAFMISDDELSQISSSLGFDKDTTLTLENISAVFRRGWLARKLKLSVHEFLMLNKLTNIDPFEALDLSATPKMGKPPILRLIELTQLLKSTSIKPHEMFYLIWNQEISGQSAPHKTVILEFSSKLRSGLQSIDNEYGLSDDPEGQIARERMTQVYGNQTTDLFFGLLENTFVTEINYDHEERELDESIMDTASGRIFYDDFRKTLGWSGAFDITSRDALKVGVSVDFESAVNKLYAENQTIIEPFFYSYPELRPFHDAYHASNDSIQVKRSNLLESFLPELKRRRKNQFALQMINNEVNSDILLTKEILENHEALHSVINVSDPALIDITAIERHGLSVDIYFSDAIPNPLPAEADYRNDLEMNLAYTSDEENKIPLNPATSDPVSGIWRGYIQAPENGNYNFYIETDLGANVVLSIDKESIPLDQDENIWSNKAAIEFISGKLYEISLTAEKIKDKLIIRWQRFGQGRINLTARYLYSAKLIDRLSLAYMRLLKTASIAEKFRLGHTEMLWFATQSSFQINEQGWLNSLPVIGSPNPVISIELLKAFTTLMRYVEMKLDLSSSNDQFINIIKNPEAKNENDESELLLLTRWNSASLDILLKRLGAITVDGRSDYSVLKDLEIFYRIYNAQALVSKLGISASDLIKATTNEPDDTTVLNLQSALRARYLESDWLKILQPINNELRSLQRNAMVAYILHQMRSNDDSAHIDTPEKLFEYFLMDVQMEPCTITSRIRHALSSIQLFIERCLMNLESKNVSPSSINAMQWEWFKRYRFWEVFRIIFFSPENFLEPELRDDQSPFFKETMSELLQSDITEERAALALLNYLRKLDEVAKLELCGMYYVENNPGTNDDIAHIVARTAGANRKYYYRRKEGGSWTPWDPLKLDIEDNPVIPVVWRGRLFVFWLRLLQDSNLVQPDLASVHLDQVKVSDMKNKNSSKINVKAILCWSEYFNEKWQPTRTSDISNPLTLYRNIDFNKFDRSALKLYTLQWGSDRDLRIIIGDKTGEGQSFYLTNVHSTPTHREPKIQHFAGKRSFVTGNSTEFSVIYPNYTDHTILKNTSQFDRVIHENHIIQGKPWDIPFFYEDKRHTFWVSTTKHTTSLNGWEFYSMDTIPERLRTDIPPTLLNLGIETPNKVFSQISTPGFGFVDSTPAQVIISKDAYINKGIGSIGTVKFGDKEIGLTGSKIKI